MALEFKVTGYRVLVQIEEPWITRDENQRRELMRQRAEKVTQLLRGLSGGVDYMGSVDWEQQSESVCSHCGAPWTEGAADKHNGGCCDEDAKNMPDDEPATPAESDNP